MISISKSSPKVHSQYLQYLALFLMEHPILKKSGTLAIIKLQKRSESNVLINLTPSSIPGYMLFMLQVLWSVFLSSLFALTTESETDYIYLGIEEGERNSTIEET